MGTRRQSFRGARAAGALVTVTALAACAGGVALDPGPYSVGSSYLPRAHSHNNYEQRRPLADALEMGFASIEVDIVLADGELYVAHGPDKVHPSLTLTRLYLDPLRQVAEENGGWIYQPPLPPLQLLVDVKTEATSTYRALRETLRDYPGLFTTWGPEGARPGPVTVVLSGNRAMDIISAEAERQVAIDGRIFEDRSAFGPETMPLVSADWETLGPDSREERLAVARTLVEQLHGEGRQVRFWATPENEDLWAALVATGVDYIGSDDIGRLDRMLRRLEAPSGAGGDG